MILIHGLGLTHAMWQWLIPALSDRYQVLSFDLLGHGQTPPPKAVPDLTLLAQQVSALMDHCGTAQATLIGFSLGGMIARRFAQDFPARTRALAILHSPHRRSAEAQAAVEARAALAQAEGPASTVEAALDRWFTREFRLANPQVMARLRHWVLANDPLIYPSFYRILANGISEIITPDPPIRCPTLVLTGDQDFGNGPDMAHAIAADIAGAQTVILSGLRHMAMVEAPARTNAPLRAFLDRVIPDE